MMPRQKKIHTPSTNELVDTFARNVKDHLVSHHLASYNQYINENIRTIIRQLNPYRITTSDGKYEIHVFVGGEDTERITFRRPTWNNGGGEEVPLTPADARRLMVSYVFSVSADVLVRFVMQGGEIIEKWYENVHVASIPIMLRSDMCVLKDTAPGEAASMGECMYDVGAYFVIDGKEKVIVSQEKLGDHHMITQWDTSVDATWMLRVALRATSREDRLFPKNHIFFVRSRQHRHHPLSIHVAYRSVRHVDDKMHIPIAVMFRALGVERDGDMMRYIFPDATPSDHSTLCMLRSCFAEHLGVWTTDAAVDYLAQYTRTGTPQQALLGIAADFLPHAGQDFRAKAIMLGHVVRKIAHMVATGHHVDRDSLLVKRVQVSGALLTYITRDFYNQWRINAMNALGREYDFGAWKSSDDVRLLVNDANIRQIFHASLIDDAIMQNFKSNRRWAIRKDASEQEAIVQDLKRISYMSAISHLRRVHTPLDDRNKATAPHRLHCSHYGMLCPHETPDGSNIGLLKHLSMLASVTFDSGWDALMDILTNSCGMRELTHRGNGTDVMFDNVWIGTVPDADSVPIAEFVRLLRRNGFIDSMISVSLDVVEHTLRFGTEQGRYTRPLLIVHNGALVWDAYRRATHDWWSLVRPNDTPRTGAPRKGTRTFADPDVIEVLRRNMCPIEYVDVSESINARIAMYESDLARADAPVYTHCEIHPMAMLGWTIANLPLVHHNPAPRVLNAGGQSKQSIGVYATTFRHRYDTEAYVMTYPQRPLMTSSISPHCGGEDLPHGQNLIVAIAPYTGYNQEDGIVVNRSSIDRGMMSITAYHSMHASEDRKKGLSLTGVVDAGTRVGDRTVLFTMQSDAGTDKSVRADKTIGGVVDKTLVRSDASGARNASVCIRDFRSLTVGDKLASRFYNKSIVGIMVPDYDMPFTADGIVPDAIVNPHSFPTRMTTAQLVESDVSRACCDDGARCVLRPLDDANHIVQQTVRGTREPCYDATSGARMPEDIVIGPNYIIRLKHQVIDKVNYRGYGPVDNILFQPLQGRGNDGGLRIGEMELAALVAHGASGFVNEAFTRKSDGVNSVYDEDTGTMPAQNAASRRRVTTSRAFEIMRHEIFAMLGIDMRIATDHA
jgi:DNA-directed RNA polymerase II subunit RPB2